MSFVAADAPFLGRWFLIKGVKAVTEERFSLGIPLKLC